jgi:hypothetical protein
MASCASRVTSADVLDVVDRSRHFHEWLDDQPANQDLVHAYFVACTKDTWIDHLSVAAARWALVTSASSAAGVAVAGPMGVGVGVAIGAADFIVERLRQGWKPNQFVEHDLKRLVS